VPDFSRSQAVFRLPVERVPATMILHDGTRSQVELFLPIADTVIDLLTGSEPFLPVARGERISLVARGAIACLAVPEDGADDATVPITTLPLVHQKVHVHLKSGVVLEGELRWVAPHGRQRTADHLNEDAPTFALYAGAMVHHVTKAHVALVEEA
jgi:hypothetical protein